MLVKLGKCSFGGEEKENWGGRNEIGNSGINSLERAHGSVTASVLVHHGDTFQKVDVWRGFHSLD